MNSAEKITQELPEQQNKISNTANFDHNNLAIEKTKESILEFEKAMQEGANSAALYCTLGNLYQSIGHFQKAEELALQSLMLHPNFLPTYRLIGEALQTRFPAKTVENCFHGIFPSYIGKTYFPNELTEIDVSDSTSITRHLALPAEKHKLFPQKCLYRDRISDFELTETNSPDRFVYVIDSGSLWYDDFNIIIHDGNNRRLKNIPGSIGYGPLCSHLMKVTPSENVNGTAMLLGARGSDGFGHWILDTLPALEAVRRSGISLDSIDKFIVSGSHLGFKKSTLKQLGIDEDRIHDVASNPHVTASKLIVFDAVTNMGRRMGEWVPEFYRKEFLESSGESMSSGSPSATDNGGQGKRIYISRGEVGNRGVENEDEFIGFLKLYGIESVTLEKLSMLEQAKLLSECDLVVAPHGAALTNIMYCKQGTKVVELFGAHVVPCFWIITRMVNLDYYNHFCKEHNDENQSGSSKQTVKTVSERVKQSYTVSITEMSDLFEYAGITKK